MTFYAVPRAVAARPLVVPAFPAPFLHPLNIHTPPSLPVRQRKMGGFDDWSNSQAGYAAIIMDSVMPRCDGPTATRELRRLGYPGAIFALTGNAVDNDVDYFLRCGCDKLFFKPLDVDLFHQAMVDLEKYFAVENQKVGAGKPRTPRGKEGGVGADGLLTQGTESGAATLQVGLYSPCPFVIPI